MEIIIKIDKNLVILNLEEKTMSKKKLTLILIKNYLKTFHIHIKKRLIAKTMI